MKNSDKSNNNDFNNSVNNKNSLDCIRNND